MEEGSNIDAAAMMPIAAGITRRYDRAFGHADRCALAFPVIPPLPRIDHVDINQDAGGKNMVYLTAKSLVAGMNLLVGGQRCRAGINATK